MFSGNNNSNAAPDSFSSFLNQQQQLAKASTSFDWGALAKQWIQNNAIVGQQQQTQHQNPFQQSFPTQSHNNNNAPPPPSINLLDNRQPNSRKFEQEQGEADMEVERDDEPDPNVLSNVQYSTSFNMGVQNSWIDSSNIQQNAQVSYVNPWQWQHQLPPPQLHIPSLLGSANSGTGSNNATNSITSSIPPLIPPEELEDKVNEAVKKKTLPAWIREGLEKMEREKQKQLEKEKKKQENETKSILNIGNDTDDDIISENKNNIQNNPGTSTVGSNNNTQNQPQNDFRDIVKKIPSHMDSDSSSSEYDGPPQEKIMPKRRESPTEIKDDNNIDNTRLPSKSYEDIVEEMMLVVKRTLTEILLDVTNDEILNITTETVKRHKLKASSAQVFRKSALSSITSKLGLGDYGNSSEDDITDTDDDKSRSGNNSERELDSEAEIRETIRKRQNAFKAVAKEIEEKASQDEARREQRSYEREKKRTSEHSRHSSSSNTNQSTSKDNENNSNNSSRKKHENRDSGETQPDKKSSSSNGKQRQRERTSRFSDNKDTKKSNSYMSVPTNSATSATSQNSSSPPLTPAQFLAANVVLKGIKEIIPTNIFQKLAKTNENNKSSSSSSSSSSSESSDSSSNSSSDSESSSSSSSRKSKRKEKSYRRSGKNTTEDRRAQKYESRRSDDHESDKSRQKDDSRSRQKRHVSSDSDDYHKKRKDYYSSKSKRDRSKSKDYSSRRDRSRSRDYSSSRKDRSRSRSNYSSSSRRRY